MADKADDSKYLWEDKTSEGHTQIGLNDLARSEIGQVTFAEFPDKMTEVSAGDPILSFEGGAKAVTEIHSPLSGKIAKMNADLIEHPELLNEDNWGKTWIVGLFLRRELSTIIFVDLSDSNSQRHLRDPGVSGSFSTFFITSPKFSDTVFHFSQPASASVVLGVNQDAYSEVNLDYIKNHHIHLARRGAGGGAVYVDSGNLTYAFIDNDNGTNYLNFKKYATPAIHVLHKLGVDAEMTGRNGLTVDGKKFSGMSSLKIGNRFSCGGTLMIDVNLDQAAKALTPPKTKLASKGIKSVHSRVTNIRQYFLPQYRQITFDEIRQLFLEEVFQTTDLAHIRTYTMSEEDWQEVEQIAHSKFTDPKFIMGTKRDDDFFHGNHFDGLGTIEVSFSVNDGIVTHARIFGDFNQANGDLQAVENQLVGTPFKHNLEEAFRTANLSANIGQISPTEMAELMLNPNFQEVN